MAAERTLPEHRNPMLVEERAPEHDILVERRCLGQTELKVKPGQVGVINATKPDNLGVLDYAHLRVPLPKDLSSSGIFSKGANRKYPEAYFLMRRSSDGYVSATGMFKAAFPYAQQDEEAAEKEYIKSLPATSSEEVAGNVWIHPKAALELAEEYGIKLWIAALLDPEPITHGSDSGKGIKSPPTFRTKEIIHNVGRSPEKKSKATEGRQSTRSTRASTRSVSPVARAKTPSRQTRTPRSRRTRGRGAHAGEAASVEPESVNGEVEPPTKLETVPETVKVEVESTTSPAVAGNEELENTKVNVEVPANHPDLPLPENTEDMLKEARRMVSEAAKIGGPSTSKGKRKADEIVDDDEKAAVEGPSAPKKARKAEVELRKERIKRRALTGIAASLAIGALVPSIVAAFGA